MTSNPISNPTSADTSTSSTYVVNSSTDVVDANDGVLTLREAIEAANAKPGADKIVINSDVNLSSSQGTLLITDDLTITGGRIQGSGASTDVFTVDNGADVTIENMTIFGGQNAIRLDNGNLTVQNATIENNFDDGIDVVGSNNNLTVRNVLIRNNLDDGIDINGNGNSVSLSNATLNGNGENGFEVEGDNNSVQISRIASINNGINGLELKDVADNNIVTLVNSTLANNAEGNLANTGSNNSLNITKVAGAPSSTGTVNVAILNPSFEIPALPTIQESPDYFLTVLSSPTQEVPGWTAYDPEGLLTGLPLDTEGNFTDAGIYNPATFYSGSVPDGINVGYGFVLDGVGAGPVGLTQTLPDELTAYTTYTLQVDIGNPQTTPDFPVDQTGFPGYRVELLAGNQVIAADNNSLTIAEGSFGMSTVTYTAQANDPFLGQNLGIRLINLNETPGFGVDFDRISLTADYLI